MLNLRMCDRALEKVRSHILDGMLIRFNQNFGKCLFFQKLELLSTD
ncbi:hypothetical protein [Argonema antarcticum]|nr:hypothetical protein [Argonema antarcticum]MCL1473102.1 hypothetical protein [Argonema antarcticum A004/B2]